MVVVYAVESEPARPRVEVVAEHPYLVSPEALASASLIFCLLSLHVTSLGYAWDLLVSVPRSRLCSASNPLE